ncbi:MAG TPA: OsmC family protein [Actinomycetota bacterium]|jgi:putative redox protein|nr:OsmC family protein [Actinomycetota bacterium]
MGDVSVRWTGNDLEFEGRTTYGASILTGGDADGSGSKASDLLPLSLAACTVYEVVVILRKQRQDLRGLEVRVTSVQDPDPPWTFRSIHLHFVLTGTVDERKAARAIELSETKYCSVAATIRSVVRLSRSHEVVPA